MSRRKLGGSNRISPHLTNVYWGGGTSISDPRASSANVYKGGGQTEGCRLEFVGATWLSISQATLPLFVASRLMLVQAFCLKAVGT